MSDEELKVCLEKAKILAEALPYIQEFRGAAIVIKYGGHAMTDETLKQYIIEDIVLLEIVGMKPVVVHGGGPEITAMMDRLGLKPKFVDGMRVTDAATMEVAEMVLSKIRGELVARINTNGGRAVGLSGKDGGLFQCRKLLAEPKDGGGAVDYGFVGEITRVDPEVIRTLEEQQFIPVVSSIGVDEKGQTYNMNADLAAAELARALKARKLVLLTDVRGVLRNPKDPSTLIPSIPAQDVAGLVSAGVISGGMIPKTDACLRALDEGVEKAHILDGRLPHALLLELLTPSGVGTQIVA
ncbi:MAG: acetylglutamate kinase [Candidatus Sumerlaeota bacterium]|nr:acetylglutamate kinase [Candidatus Sumerlaeota bacterium]